MDVMCAGYKADRFTHGDFVISATNCNLHATDDDLQKVFLGNAKESLTT